MQVQARRYGGLGDVGNIADSLTLICTCFGFNSAHLMAMLGSVWRHTTGILRLQFVTCSLLLFELDVKLCLRGLRCSVRMICRRCFSYRSCQLATILLVYCYLYQNIISSKFKVLVVAFSRDKYLPDSDYCLCHVCYCVSLKVRRKFYPLDTAHNRWNLNHCLAYLCYSTSANHIDT